MKITFILPPVNMSGGIRVVAIYAKKLSERGHHVTLVSPPPEVPSVKKKIASFFKGQGRPAYSRYPKSHLDSLQLNHHVLDRFRPVTDADIPDADVVIATWWETAEWVNELSAAKGKKFYFVQHHEVFPLLPQDRCRATYHMPLHKIVVAKWLADVMRDEYGAPHVDIVPNAVDHRQFFAEPRGKQTSPTVGFLYHETPFKGIDVTLAALDKLREFFPTLRAISFGSRPPSGRFALADYIEFHLSPHQETLKDLYARCDVWVAASRSEGFNLPAMEAMACRTPVVSTRAGWPEEAIISGNNGVLVDVDDLEGLVDGAKWVLGLDDTEWRKTSENAYQTVAESSWDNSAGLFEMVLNDVCRN